MRLGFPAMKTFAKNAKIFFQKPYLQQLRKKTCGTLCSESSALEVLLYQNVRLFPLENCRTGRRLLDSINIKYSYCRLYTDLFYLIGWFPRAFFALKQHQIHVRLFKWRRSKYIESFMHRLIKITDRTLYVVFLRFISISFTTTLG